MALALSPLLALSAAQAYIEYRDEVADRQARLILMAREATDAADDVVAGARPLLEALRAQRPVAEAVAGCSETFAAMMPGVPGYSNIVRVDSDDRLICSALPVANTPLVGGGDWTDKLREGADFALSEVFEGAISRRAVMLAGVPVRDAAGRYDGAVALSIDVAALPVGEVSEVGGAESRVALADRAGRVFLNADALGTDAIPAETLEEALDGRGAFWSLRRSRGDQDEFVVAPIGDGDIFMVISAQQLGWISWGLINAAGAALLPLVMWLLALTAVSLAADRMVLRWIVYLRRIAQIYAGGRLRVEPRRAKSAPAEIRELAETLDQMANRIAEREAEITDALEQKTVLIKEIHHRVKNNLQIIISLLSLQISRSADPGTAAKLDDARSRINALALVHKSLYEAEDLRLIALEPFLHELMAQLSQVAGADGERVAVAVEVEPIELTTESAVPLALFATECATNSFKHAFVGRESGRVRVRLRRLGDEELQLDIEDDGEGWGANESDGRGIGSSLMTAFARQLGGEVERGASDLGGARVSLIFPPERRRA